MAQGFRLESAQNIALDFLLNVEHLNQKATNCTHQSNYSDKNCNNPFAAPE